MSHNYSHLTPYDRYLIWLGVSLNKSRIEIAACLGRHRSTVYREIARNHSSFKKEYHRWKAQNFYCERRKTAAESRSKIHGNLKTIIAEYLQKDWSPEQIAGRGRLTREFYVCHETIYQFLYKQRLLYGCNLWKHLRRSKPARRRRFPGCRSFRWEIKNRPQITERPVSVEKRTRLGDFERDLILGPKDQHEALLTIADRKSRFLKIMRVKNRQASIVHDATLKALKEEKIVRSITNDNGGEFKYYKKTARILKTNIYFTRPYAAWERGTIENTNGLIRKYFPKKTNFREVTNAQIYQVQKSINNRPRKTLGYRTPQEVHCQAS